MYTYHTNHQKKDSRGRDKNAAGLRSAAAGLAGLLCAAGIPGALPASAGETAALPAAIERTAASPSAAQEWKESRILRRWDIDPEDLPPEDEEELPLIPEELTPYFQEKTAFAVWSYDGRVPPSADLTKYSPRADAIRAAVLARAEKKMQESGEQIFSEVRTLMEMSRDQLIPQIYASILQKANGSAYTDKDYGTLPQAASSGQGQAEGRTSAGQEAENDGSESAQKPAGGELPPLFSHFLTDPVPDRNKDASQDHSEGQQSVVNAFLKAGEKAEDLRTEDAEGEGSAEDLKTEDAEGKASPEDLYESGEPAGDREEDGETDLPETEAYAGSGVEKVYGGPRIPFAMTDTDAGQSLYEAADSAEQRRTVFIGDSRTVGIQIYVGGEENEYWSARNSMGYNWMVDSGVPAVEDLIGENTDVVILMGVNDLGNVYRYADYINMKAAEWKQRGAETYFVSVTPVDDRRSPSAKNSRIESFNSYMIETLQNVHYIDAYNRIRYSFGSPDGIHYDRATYQEIYQIIHFHLYKGWYEENGLRFWFAHGEPQTGWLYLDGSWQYMDGSGVRWIRDSRVGDVVLAPWPETDLLDPYQGVFH